MLYKKKKKSGFFALIRLVFLQFPIQEIPNLKKFLQFYLIFHPFNKIATYCSKQTLWLISAVILQNRSPNWSLTKSFRCTKKWLKGMQQYSTQFPVFMSLTWTQFCGIFFIFHNEIQPNSWIHGFRFSFSLFCFFTFFKLHKIHVGSNFGGHLFTGWTLD